ncbi:MAG: ABC transporter ATP-binding protein [Polyangiaceae bacterium]|nr:ABC transporter ATP-binding protein [Polyangiaceae bacterium]
MRVSGLRKRFGSVDAVAGLSFHADPGETVGLLGPNGAGKSTTMALLVGLLAPDAGSIEIAGTSDPTRPAARRRLGIAPQDLALYSELTAEENLRFFGRLHGLRGRRLAERVERCLAMAGLQERRDDRVGTFSGGMQRRLNVAAALVHDPSVVLLDEPTVGVDPQSRNHILDALGQLRSEGRTLLYSTHYMEEATRLCDRVVVVDRGRVLAEGTVPDLVARHGGRSRAHFTLATPPPPGTCVGGRPLHEFGGVLETDDPTQALAELARSGLALEAVTVESPNLERVFLNLTGRTLRD